MEFTVPEPLNRGRAGNSGFLKFLEVTLMDVTVPVMFSWRTETTFVLMLLFLKIFCLQEVLSYTCFAWILVCYFESYMFSQKSLVKHGLSAKFKKNVARMALDQRTTLTLCAYPVDLIIFNCDEMSTPWNFCLVY